ncbi:MAG: peptidoglycan DD-metalloendopeptidase family protein [Actinomycetota bacterium]|nr:peptidoglycan DD-metalloendopeptidase family protein [Actinomycetota bacterium]MDQ6946306.1 peptidoglycan DD-metalloendopeptidase family protein [Actinomycetota bacterium]
MRLRVLFTSIVVAAALIYSAPAGADDLSGRRSQARAKQAQVRGQLDLALASDAAVESRLNTLNAEVTTSQNRLEDARRAQGAASAEFADATRRLADTTARLNETRLQLKAVAIRAYMRPLQQTASSAAADVNEVARGQALLTVALGTQGDVLDATRQAEHDRVQAKSVVQTALGTAAARTKVASDRSADLAGAQRAQQAVHAELQKRIADLRQETADLAAQESGIEALISAAAAKAAPGTGGGVFSAGPVSGTGLIWPIHGPVTSEFGPRWGGFHPGIDIAPPYGTPIHAAKDGVVIFAGPEGGYGNFVLIDHGGGIVTGYAHQSRIAVTQGQSVTQGQVIGFEGSTGDSTGPHLHFEVRVNAVPQNPRGFESGSP